MLFFAKISSSLETDNVLKHRPDIVLVPDTVEGRTGYELCNQVSKTPPQGRHVPVLLTTCALDRD